jgi:hypothetical protein
MKWSLGQNTFSFIFVTFERYVVLIDQFVIGPLNVSRERIYLPAKCGGIGMFDQKFSYRLSGARG